MTSATISGARRVPLARTAFGDKVVMATTGALLVGYIITHVLANLLVFAGAEYINGYGRLLHATGPLLWVARAVLLLAAVLHVRAAVRLARRAHAARGVGYARGTRQSAPFATRTIRWGGAVLFVFLLVHVPQFTGGVLHPSFVTGDDFHNVVRGFRTPWIAALNFAAALVVGLHVYHGVRAASSTLGAPSQGSSAVRRGALALALLVALGFASIPLAVLAGVLGD